MKNASVLTADYINGTESNSIASFYVARPTTWGVVARHLLVLAESARLYIIIYCIYESRKPLKHNFRPNANVRIRPCIFHVFFCGARKQALGRAQGSLCSLLVD